jgi:hypothetical protein
VGVWQKSLLPSCVLNIAELARAREKKIFRLLLNYGILLSE